MPNIAERTKVLVGKGVVLSFTSDPNIFLYWKLVTNTKKYKYKVIEGVNNLKDEYDKSLDGHNALRNEIAYQTEEAALTKNQNEIETNKPRRNRRQIDYIYLYKRY